MDSFMLYSLDLIKQVDLTSNMELFGFVHVVIIANANRECGWRTLEAAPACAEPCSVCLERKCMVAVEGKCILNLTF